MRGIVIKVNYRRSLAIFEDSLGDYGYFEMLGKDDLDEDDVIVGNLHHLGREVIVKEKTGEKYDVYIEDFGMSLKIAMDQVFG